MRLVIQRVSSCFVKVNKEIISEIGSGALVLFGVHLKDKISQVTPLVKRLINLRFFPDEEGKANLSLFEKKAELLIVSQFTLYADCRTGRRPSFSDAAPRNEAQKLYEAFVNSAQTLIPNVQTGSFGDKMEVGMVNDGPFTLILES